MSRELWAEERCDHEGWLTPHDFSEKWGWVPCSAHQLNIECVAIRHCAGAHTRLDFDAIWARYYEVTDTFRLTEDELRKVVFGE